MRVGTNIALGTAVAATVVATTASVFARGSAASTAHAHSSVHANAAAHGNFAANGNTAADATATVNAAVDAGSSVMRQSQSIAQLEAADPRLAGKLDRAPVGEAPASMALRQAGDGTRILTINIHQSVPKGHQLNVTNQDIRALRDVAAYVNAIDPDIVAVQEIHDQAPNGSGVPRQASVLKHLLDADAMAYTPAIGAEASGDPSRTYGNAIYTRNGFDIVQAHNVDLPNGDSHEFEDRSMGLAVVRTPKGTNLLVANAHLTDRADRAAIRERQLSRIIDAAREVRSTGELAYRDALTDADLRATSLPKDAPLIVTGDLNSRRVPHQPEEQGFQGPDAMLSTNLGLQHANDAGSTVAQNRGLFIVRAAVDHIYASRSVAPQWYFMSEVPNRELPRDTYADGTKTIIPTDHPVVVTQLDRS